jgi:hypothetical protein
LWSTHTTVTGACPSYRFLAQDDEDKDTKTAAEEDSPNTASRHVELGVTLPQLRVALAAMAAHGRRCVSIERIEFEEPLTPIQCFTALMPSSDLLPAAVQRVARRKPQLASNLHAARTAVEVSRSVEALFALVDVEELSPAERFLTQFGRPADVVGYGLAADVSPADATRVVTAVPVLRAASDAAVVFAPLDNLPAREAEPLASAAVVDTASHGCRGSSGLRPVDRRRLEEELARRKRQRATPI